MLDVMTKHLVDIDDRLLERARAISGEATIKGTIDVALKKLTNDGLLREHLAWLGDPNNGVDPALLAEVRTPRVPVSAGDDE